MYPRIFQNLLTASTKLKHQRTLKTASLILSNAALLTQKKLPYTIPHCQMKYFSSESELTDIYGINQLPKDPKEKKLLLEKKAQEEIDEIVKNNPEMEKFMKVLELEISVRRQDGERIPSNLRPRDWLELLKLNSKQQRRKYLNYLFIVEKQKEKHLLERMENNLLLEQVREQRKYEEESDEIIYGIGRNTYLRRIMEPTMNKHWNWNAIKATMFGNKIVFDFSLEMHMNAREVKSCAKQIMEAHAINRRHNFPFAVYLCNVNIKGELIKRLHAFIPTLFEDEFPFHITSKSYLDLFGKDNLVYLTSNAPKEIEVYDPNMVYIIGALVDRGPAQPVSMAKAKKEDIQMFKLPLDTRTKFGFGSGKDLTLNQVFAIMLDAQDNDWDKALSHVPRRKLYETKLRYLEKRLQYEMYSESEAGDTISDKLDFERKFPNYQNTVSQIVLKRKQESTNNNNNNKFQSSSVNDFSHSARAKLKKQWSD